MSVDLIMVDAATKIVGTKTIYAKVQSRVSLPQLQLSPQQLQLSRNNFRPEKSFLMAPVEDLLSRFISSKSGF